jgi:hypothetical protein
MIILVHGRLAGLGNPRVGGHVVNRDGDYVMKTRAI